ncbi:MAG: hypothetical protein KAT04_13480 [Methylococcales bacterium]|nr:hypothetical protein [Methylococcales bacterium]
MNENTPNSAPAAKKVKYIASIIYLLVFAFVVGGSYINQQLVADDVNAEKKSIEESIKE